MTVEVANFVGQLVPANPSSTDGVSEGDNHIRLLKAILQATFPNLTFSIAFNETTKVVLEATTIAAMRTALGAVSLGDANIFTQDQLIRRTDEGSGVAPSYGLDRNTLTPEALDLLGRYYFQGRNSLLATIDYADLVAMIISKTAATESGAIALRTALAGTFATRFIVGAGLYSLNATDGDKGIDTINAKRIYKDGVELVVPSPLVAFSANKNAVDQSGIVSATPTKLTFDTEVFDAGAYYDVTTSRFTPPAGTYQFNAAAYFSAGVVSSFLYWLTLYKNGSVFLAGPLLQAASGNPIAPGLSVIAEANGTDYFELYCTGGGSGNKTINGTTSLTYFQAHSI